MARISPDQVSSDAVDSVGVSVTIAPRRASDPRYGALYDISTLAASVPVHLHRLTNEQYLMIFSRRWHSATPSAGDPGGYTDFTEDTTPGWVKVSVPTGQRVTMSNGYTIPLVSNYDTPVLVDAVSRSTEYLYLLTSVNNGTKAVVSHWWQNTTTGAVIKHAEEQVTGAYSRPANTSERAWLDMDDAEHEATGDSVVFDRGLWFLSPHLIVIGASSDNRLFMARKPWGRIGINLIEKSNSEYGAPMGTAEDPRWSYFTGDGWSVDPSQAVPITDSTGTVITSEGPVSVVTYRDQTWMSTVIAEGTNRSARIYTQRGQRAWVAQDSIHLGSTADGSYLDTLRFQQQVPPSTTSDTMLNSDSALVYVISTRSTTGGVSTLKNTWGLLPVMSAGSRTSPLDSTAINASLAVVAAANSSTDTASAGVGGT
jgi:hypothetical protein